MALGYALQFGISFSQLSREYGLNRCTLYRIARGETFIRNRRWYHDSLILALNDCRLRAKACCNDELEYRIVRAISEVCLVAANIATDAEISTK